MLVAEDYCASRPRIGCDGNIVHGPFDFIFLFGLIFHVSLLGDIRGKNIIEGCIENIGRVPGVSLRDGRLCTDPSVRSRPEIQLVDQSEIQLVHKSNVQLFDQSKVQLFRKP